LILFIGEFSPGNRFDALIVGYYEGRTLKFVSKVKNGFVPHVRRGTFFGCCASAMTATASSTTTNRIDKIQAFLIAHIMRYVSCGRY